MTKVTNMTCIVCPMGCSLEVTESTGLANSGDTQNSAIVTGRKFSVKGNTCPRGAQYAIKELTNPTRTLTCTVLVDGGAMRLVPAKSNVEIPRDMQKECMEVVRRLKVKGPVKAGDVLCRNILDTGADIVACVDC